MHLHFNINYYIQKQKVHCTTNCVVRYTLSLTEPSLREKKALSLHFNSWFLASEFHVTNICFWTFSAYPRALSMFYFKVLWMFKFFMADFANYLVCDWQKQYSQKYLFKKMSCAHKCYMIEFYLSDVHLNFTSCSFVQIHVHAHLRLTCISGCYLVLQSSDRWKNGKTCDLLISLFFESH